MFFKILAIEQPLCRVLSYAPGPMETAMFNQIRNESFDDELKKMFQGKFKFCICLYFAT